MKKRIIYVAIVELALVGGYFWGRIDSPRIIISESESSEFKREMIDAQSEALDMADKVMDNNDLWDIDGSDDMSEYLELREKVDSLWRTQC